MIEIEPGRWVVDRRTTAPARSDLPRPYVIGDVMDPAEQVDGNFYTSKAKFRAVGKAHGLIEVGNEKFRPKQRSSASRAEKEARRQSLKKAVEKYKAGYRAKQFA